jgi:hypothetical protein
VAHRYRHPIQVSCSADLPASFIWRGARYRIVEVLSTWHLQDRWWQPTTAPAPSSTAPSTAPSIASTQESDRRYYRVRCADQQTFDLYYDTVSACWILDCVHD